MTTASEVDNLLLAIAPELTAVTPDRRLIFVEMAMLQVGCAFGESQTMATAYLAAHFLTVSNSGSTGGQVTKEKVGQIEKTYAPPETGQDGSGYLRTTYGQQFIELRNTILPIGNTY